MSKFIEIEYQYWDNLYRKMQQSTQIINTDKIVQINPIEEGRSQVWLDGNNSCITMIKPTYNEFKDLFVE